MADEIKPGRMTSEGVIPADQWNRMRRLALTAAGEAGGAGGDETFASPAGGTTRSHSEPAETGMPTAFECALTAAGDKLVFSPGCFQAPWSDPGWSEVAPEKWRVIIPTVGGTDAEIGDGAPELAVTGTGKVWALVTHRCREVEVYIGESSAPVTVTVWEPETVEIAAGASAPAQTREIKVLILADYEAAGSGLRLKPRLRGDHVLAWHWDFGAKCTGGSEPSGPSGSASSEPSGSGSGPSGSGPSGSGPSGSVPSGSGSGSGSEPSGSGPSGSGPSGSGSGSGSSKTAIVPHGEEWVGWVCTERPEAVFEDVVEVRLRGAFGLARVPEEFLSAVEPETMRATSAMGTDAPAIMAARVHRDGGAADVFVVVQAAPVPGVPACSRAVVRIEGVRRGQAGRWRRYAPEVAAANDAFWRRAHEPAAPAGETPEEESDDDTGGDGGDRRD